MKSMKPKSGCLIKTPVRRIMEGGEMQIANIRTGRKGITADLTDIITRIIQALKILKKNNTGKKKEQ